MLSSSLKLFTFHLFQTKRVREEKKHPNDNKLNNKERTTISFNGSQIQTRGTQDVPSQLPRDSKASSVVRLIA